MNDWIESIKERERKKRRRRDTAKREREREREKERETASSQAFANIRQFLVRFLLISSLSSLSLSRSPLPVLSLSLFPSSLRRIFVEMKITLRAAFAVPALFATVLVVCGGVRSAYARSSPRATATGNNSELFITAADCDQVTLLFDSKNITFALSDETAPMEHPSKTICGGKCCNEKTEKHLKQRARIDFHDLIHHHSRSLQGLLATTAEALRETVTTLARQSENKTLTLFDQVYRSMAVLSRPSIKALYQAMVDYVSPVNTPDNLQQPLSREVLQERFVEFFMRLFPIAYHRAINPRQDQQDFTDKFKTCLYETMADIQPFDDIPQHISRSVSKSLEATRVLVQALTLGKTVLDKTDSVLFATSTISSQQEACYGALFRMTSCPKCKGIEAAPCSGFCTNVMRGCLMEPASELDLAWSGYVETVERLVVAVNGNNDNLGLNAEKAIRQLDTRISDAIMHAMENGPMLEEKVRKVCGRSELLPSNEESPTFSNTPASKSTTSSSNDGMHTSATSSSHGSAHRAVPTLHIQLGYFLASAVRSRIFYGTLADAICEEHPDKHCWNGERIGEYTKTVVDSSLTAQRYNPEFTITTISSTPTSYGNMNTSTLIDQLRHINQIVQSQLASTPDTGAFLGDEAVDGSGSGDSPVWRPHANGGIDDDEDSRDDDRDDDDEASGSGMGPTTTDSSVKIHQNGSVRDGSSIILLLSSVLTIAGASFIV